MMKVFLSILNKLQPYDLNELPAAEILVSAAVDTKLPLFSKGLIKSHSFRSLNKKNHLCTNSIYIK